MPSLTIDQITDQLYKMTFGHPKIMTPFGYRYVINADVTASGYPNKMIETYMQNRILPYYNNTHSNAVTGRMMSHYIHKSKQIIKREINAHADDQIIFTGNGCSGAVNHLIHCLDLQHQSPENTVVFISKAEHHSNHLPWVHLPITLVYVPLLKNGLFDLEFLERQLTIYQRYTRIYVSLTATSNVTGVHQHTTKVSQLIHKYGGYVFWDYAASSPYVKINMHTNDNNGQYYDAIYMSVHKFFGGPGTPGVLIAHRRLFQNDVPYCPAGGTVRFACPLYQTYSDDIETKETGGTPNILGSIKAGLVFDLKSRYLSYIEYWDNYMTQYIQVKLANIKGINILNPLQNLNRQPIFAFMINDLHYNLIVVLLNDLFGIQSRGGISCCSLLAQDLLGISPVQQKRIHDQIVSGRGMPADYGWCRLSFHYSMPLFIIDYIIEAVRFIGQYGYQFKKLYKYYPEHNTWMYCPNNCPWNDFGQLDLNIDDYNQKTYTIYLNKTILNSQLNAAYTIVSTYLK